MSDLHGYYFEDLQEGMSKSFSKTITEADITMFAGVSGDTNPVHLDEEFASATMFKSRIAHGMLSASFISTVVGTKLPGPGCIYVRCDQQIVLFSYLKHTPRNVAPPYLLYRFSTEETTRTPQQNSSHPL